MDLREDQVKVCQLIKETVALLCKSSLKYDFQFTIEGLLGITVDKKEVFLVNVSDSFIDSSYQEPDSVSKDDNVEHELDNPPLGQSKPGKKSKKRKAHRSMVTPQNFDTMDSDDIWQNPSNESSKDSLTTAKRPRSGDDPDCEDTNDNGDFITGIKSIKGEQIDSEEDDIVIVKEERDGSFAKQPTISASPLQPKRLPVSGASSTSGFHSHIPGNISSPGPSQSSQSFLLPSSSASANPSDISSSDPNAVSI